jgi:hypothetical protein
VTIITLAFAQLSWLGVVEQPNALSETLFRFCCVAP